MKVMQILIGAYVNTGRDKIVLVNSRDKADFILSLTLMLFQSCRAYSTTIIY